MGVSGGEVMGEVTVDESCDPPESVSESNGRRPMGTAVRYWDPGLPDTGSASWLARGSERWISFSSSKSLLKVYQSHER